MRFFLHSCLRYLSGWIGSKNQDDTPTWYIKIILSLLSSLQQRPTETETMMLREPSKFPYKKSLELLHCRADIVTGEKCSQNGLASNNLLCNVSLGRRWRTIFCINQIFRLNIIQLDCVHNNHYPVQVFWMR